MKNIIKIIIIICICVTSYKLQVTNIYAQQVSLGISPPLLKAIIKPGKTIMIAYRLENYEDPMLISSKVLPFEARDNMGNINIKNQFEGPIRFSLDNSDIQLDKTYFLDSQSSQQLLLRMRVPEGAPNGDYYYTFLSETQPPPTTEGIQSARAKATIGSNILITVTDSGVIDVKGKVALFDIMARYTVNLFGTQYKIFDSNDKIPFVLIVDNKGKNVIAPEGTIVIKGNFGEKAQYEIVPQNILAESQRLITATPSGNLNCPESGKKPSYCQKPISLLISGLFIGLYKASTSINFGENSPNIFASTSFIAIPFKLMIGLIVVIFIGIIIIKKMKDNEE